MDPEASIPTISRSPWRYFVLIVTALLIVGLGAFLYFRSHNQEGFVSGLVTDPETNLVDTNGRTNLVILGLGGEEHEGGDLTDSMIFVSLSHQTHSITMLSVPRDIWVTSMQAKINTAYHYGQERREGGGLDLVKSAVSEIIGQPVHYALTLDFAGFVKAIDAVGGLDITVNNTFDDYLYPIPGKETAEPESERYEHLHFEAGPLHLDGTTALKYARSRHAEGEEGTDFARSARQQQIILAFKNKLLSAETLLSQSTLQSLIASFKDNIDTNIQDGEFGSFLHFFLSYSTSNQEITSLNIDDLLTNPKNTTPYQGQWVLTPLDSWVEVHAYVAENLAE